MQKRFLEWPAVGDHPPGQRQVEAVPPEGRVGLGSACDQLVHGDQVLRRAVPPSLLHAVGGEAVLVNGDEDRQLGRSMVRVVPPGGVARQHPGECAASPLVDRGHRRPPLGPANQLQRTFTAEATGARRQPGRDHLNAHAIAERSIDAGLGRLQNGHRHAVRVEIVQVLPHQAPQQAPAPSRGLHPGRGQDRSRHLGSGHGQARRDVRQAGHHPARLLGGEEAAPLQHRSPGLVLGLGQSHAPGPPLALQPGVEAAHAALATPARASAIRTICWTSSA